MTDPHFSFSWSTQEPSSLGEGRAKKGERRVTDMGGLRLRGSASWCQKFQPGFQPHILENRPTYAIIRL